MKNLIPASLVLIFVFLLASCSPQLSATIFDPQPQLSESEEVNVFTYSEPQPNEVTTIGILDFKPRPSFRCSNEEQLEIFKNEARKGGANAIKITESYAKDDNGCIETRGYFLSLKNPENYINKDRYLHASEDTATLFLYRIVNLHKKEPATPF